MVEVFTVHSAYEDVDPLCNAGLASDTVRAVFVTRELEYKVVAPVVELMIEAIRAEVLVSLVFLASDGLM